MESPVLHLHKYVVFSSAAYTTAYGRCSACRDYCSSIDRGNPLARQRKFEKTSVGDVSLFLSNVLRAPGYWFFADTSDALAGLKLKERDNRIFFGLLFALRCLSSNSMCVKASIYVPSLLGALDSVLLFICLFFHSEEIPTHDREPRRHSRTPGV